MYSHMMNSQITYMNGIFRIFVITGLAFVLCWNSALADDLFNTDYPGLGEHGNVLIVANSQVRDAIAAYQLVKGELPHTWQDVLNSGLFDSSLRGFNMEIIDPDDSSIDFKGDIYLDSITLKEASGDLLLFTFWSPTSNNITRSKIERVESYREVLQRVADTLELEPEQSQIIDSWLEDEAQLIQFGHLHQLFLALDDFRKIHGNLPDDLKELVKSGVGPLTETSVNPVTGEIYRFDGSSGDLFFHVRENGRGFVLRHVDAKFEPQFGFTY